MSKFDVFSSKFSHDIFMNKYSMNGQETWADTCKRVVESVCGQYLNSETREAIFKLMYERKFIPGGRYLYSSGRPFKQVNNCVIFRAEDSREGWSELLYKSSMSLMTGAGIGIDYTRIRPEGATISRTGGFATGPLSVMHMINECGRYIMQGGSRRSAIWAGLAWSHADIEKFIKLKNHSNELMALKEKDLKFHLPMELTNISVIYDTEFFLAIENERHPKHEQAKKIWKLNCLQAFSTAEPGMSFNYLKDNESLRNAPVAGNTEVYTKEGYQKVIDIVNKKVKVWTGKRWALTIFKKTKENSELVFIHMGNGRSITCDPEHPFLVYKEGGIERVASGKLNVGDKLVVSVPYTNDGKVICEAEEKVISVEKLDYKEDVYCCDVGVEEHSFMAEGVIISNCTEVTSEDDSDKCNLGTVWINRFTSKAEFAKACYLSTQFLLCGGLYSDVPTEKIREVGLKNNRIGLGLGGIHEWLMIKGYDYEVVPELHKWLNAYKTESDSAAYICARELGVAIPKGKRAIAPNGSIGILAETTTGIEPIFCSAYKRRYFKDDKWMYQYVIDGAVKRMVEKGVDISIIKDAYDLTLEQRVKFQADVQNYVDMSISSTINLPSWGSDKNGEHNLKVNSDILLKYAKRLRGITCYPDGCRSGQPLTKVGLEEALKQEGTIFEETERECLNGVCGV